MGEGGGGRKDGKGNHTLKKERQPQAGRERQRQLGEAGRQLGEAGRQLEEAGRLGETGGFTREHGNHTK